MKKPKPKVTYVGNLFDVIKAKEEAMARVEQHATLEWKEEALRCVRWVAHRKPDFTVDDVREEMERRALDDPDYPTTHDTRAMGPVMTRAIKAGYIESTNLLRPGRFVSSHGRRQQIWKSKIYRQNSLNGKEVSDDYQTQIRQRKAKDE